MGRRSNRLPVSIFRRSFFLCFRVPEAAALPDELCQPQAPQGGSYRALLDRVVSRLRGLHDIDAGHSRVLRDDVADDLDGVR